MAEYIAIVHRNGGGIGSEIHQHAAGAFLCLGEHGIGHRERRQIHLGYCNAGIVETFVQTAVERLTP